MDPIKVFLDSDVIISAMLSSNGDSFAILQNLRIKKFISQAIHREVMDVAQRLHIPYTTQQQLLKEVEIIELKLEKTRIIEEFVPYVFDEEDSHVIAGVYKAGVHFLLIHNLKRYHREKIKQRFDVITMKPGIFLQYLRGK